MQALFHIVDARQWPAAGAGGHYRPDSLSQEGFVHCSFAAQVAESAARHFAGAQELVVLQLDPATIGAPIVIEDSFGSGTAFPHVYGPIPIEAVVAVLQLSAFRLDSDAASPDR